MSANEILSQALAVEVAKVRKLKAALEIEQALVAVMRTDILELDKRLRADLAYGEVDMGDIEKELHRIATFEDGRAG